MGFNWLQHEFFAGEFQAPLHIAPLQFQLLGCGQSRYQDLLGDALLPRQFEHGVHGATRTAGEGGPVLLRAHGHLDGITSEGAPGLRHGRQRGHSSEH